ncbi:MAG: DUF418 domain-containing protein [Bacteroidales bacterium]|jgi:uncharacterized protein|nr:DUF418 domain-containing protein [Bacteroidales bacterium]
MAAEIQPTTQRISSIDILRGFALLGIVMVNALGFNASFFNFGGYYTSLPNADQQSYYNIFISLTADKFIFIFSFLFGYGIYMQYKKFLDNNKAFGGFFARRMLVLALFGMLHVLLLWAGDILLPYAIAGFIVFLLRKIPAGFQFALGMFFYLFTVFYLSAGVWITLPDSMSSTCTECLEQAKMVYQNGSYFDILQLRLQEYFAFRNINLFYYLPKILGITMMGFAASRFRLHEKIEKDRIFWAAMWLIFAGIAAFLYFNYESFVVEGCPYAGAMYMGGYELMNFFVAGTYILTMLLLSSFQRVSNILKPLANMGRMSLTNYLLQSVLLGFIFYGWGLCYFGMTEVTMVIKIALVVFLAEVFISHLWFQKYSIGPLERIWRRLSYGRRK